MILDKVIVVSSAKVEKKEETANTIAMNARFVYAEMGHQMVIFVG